MTSGRKPTFVLGVGVQKAGTSWLHTYLSSHPRFAAAHPKEMHIFDAMLRPEEFGYFRTRAELAIRTENKAMALLRSLRRSGTTASHSQRIEMMSDPRRYVEFYLKLAGDGGCTGDITPSYSALSREDYEYIRDLLMPHFDLRVILLLRDPIARTYSRVRHFRRRYKQSFPVAARGDDNDAFARVYNTAHVWSRADYPRIVTSLEAVFPHLYIGFFERLFQQDEVDRICDFIGIDRFPADFDRVVNASPLSVPLSPENRKLALAAYEPVYTFCRERFDGVGDIWGFSN